MTCFDFRAVDIISLGENRNFYALSFSRESESILSKNVGEKNTSLPIFLDSEGQYDFVQSFRSPRHGSLSTDSSFWLQFVEIARKIMHKKELGCFNFLPQNETIF